MSKSRRTTGSAPKLFLFILILFGVALAVYLLVQKQTAKEAFPANSPEAVSSFLSQYGWEVEDNPESKVVVIPETFSDVYSAYNALQKKQGFNLAKHKGKMATSYTFHITNHPDGSEVFANVLVIDNYIAGGDICSYAIDGFMTGFDGKTV